jgi:hypothetical protein
MKKINILLFFSLCYFFSQAQISFTRTDMPAVGWINPEQEDTVRNAVAVVNFGNKGANQVYDFSSLHETILDSVYYYALTNAQQSVVPNANLSVFVPPTTYLFAEDTTSLYAYTGLQAVVFATTVLSKYTTPDSIYKFPLVYGQNFRGNYGGSIKLLATTVNSNLGLLGWDSIMVSITASYTDTIDGWGTVKTPVGTYNCLRQKRVEIDTTTYYYNTSPGGPYTLMPTTIIGTQVLAANPAIAAPATSYAYLAKEAKGPVISFTYDSISQPITANWTSIRPHAPVALKDTASVLEIGYVTINALANDSNFQSPDTVCITGIYGTPSHPAAADSARVSGCSQIVFHASLVPGLDTFYYRSCDTHLTALCDTGMVVVDVRAPRAPKAVKDVASILESGTITIHVLANDSNFNAPDTVCVTGVYGTASNPAAADSATVTTCKLVNFHASLVPGIDSFYYISCDMHYGTLCDTGLVVVTVNAPHAPIALEDTASVLVSGPVTINVLANDINLNAPDTVCITGIYGTVADPAAADSARVSGCSQIVFHASQVPGLDTFYYRSCDTHFPALCDTGLVVVTVRALPPVAVITPSGQDTICHGASVVLRAQNSAGYTFLWSNNSTADSIIVSTGGPYTVKVYHNGDSAMSSPTVVVISAPPSTALTLTGPASFCIGDSTLLSAAAGLTYHWSTGANTQSIWVKTTGSYTVTVTNSNGCTAASSPEAMTANPPQLDTITHSGPVLTSKTEAAYQWYEGSNQLTGATSQTYTATQSGVYTVHFTDSHGCTSVSNSITLTVGINEISPADYKIYPNPASDQIQLDLSHIDQATLNDLSEIVIYNLLGEKLRSIPVSQTSISVKDLSNGIYLIGVMDKNQNKKILAKFDVLK